MANNNPPLAQMLWAVRRWWKRQIRYQQCCEALVSEPERLHDKLAFARGYVSAIAAMRPESHSAPLEKVKSLIAEVEQLGRRIIPKIKPHTERATNSKDETEVRRFLAETVLLVDHLRLLVDYRRRYPRIAQYFPESSQLIFEEMLDRFEEAQETLALGCSAEFRKDIEQARSEAGVEGAKADLSMK